MTARGWARRWRTTRCLRSRRSCWWPRRLPAWCSAPEAVRGEIVGQLDHLVGREGALAVQSLLEGASQRPRRHHRHRDWRHHVPGRGDRRVPRAAGRAQHHLAREAEAGRSPLRVRDRSAALVWPGGGDRLPAAGLAGGDRGAGRAQRMALQPVPRQRARSGTSSTRWCRSW